MSGESRRVGAIAALFAALEPDEISGHCLLSPKNRVAAGYAAHIAQCLPSASVCYADDGNPVIFAMIGTGGVRVCGFRWCNADFLVNADNGGPGVAAGSDFGVFEFSDPGRSPRHSSALSSPRVFIDTETDTEAGVTSEAVTHGVDSAGADGSGCSGAGSGVCGGVCGGGGGSNLLAVGDRAQTTGGVRRALGGKRSSLNLNRESSMLLPRATSVAGEEDEIPPPTRRSHSLHAHECGGVPRRLLWSSQRETVDWSRVKAVMVYAHGITENARSGLISCAAVHAVFGREGAEHTAPLTREEQEALRAEVTERGGERLRWQDSWPDTLTRAGVVVYALDAQGHGYSEGWRGDRCNVERLAHMEIDMVELIRSLRSSGEVPPTVPIFVSGLSLGGLVAVRALQMGFARGLLGNETTPVSGGIFLAPAISYERLRKKFPNQFLLPVLGLVSRVTPSWRAARLQDDVPYAFLPPLIQRDPLIFADRLPCRISAESVVEMDSVLPAAQSFPPDLPILIIQSKHDTMTDPEGSEAFIREVPCTDKRVHWLDYGWHWLAKEPGYHHTVGIVIDWINQHLPPPTQKPNK